MSHFVSILGHDNHKHKILTGRPVMKQQTCNVRSHPQVGHVSSRGMVQQQNQQGAELVDLEDPDQDHQEPVM